MRLQVEDWVFDSDTREVIRGGAVVGLSPKAFDLLHLLIEQRPKAVSKAEIHERLWPETHVSPANLANLIVELRSALGDDARRPRFIRTVRRFGYSFCAEARVVSDEAPPARGATVYRLIWGVREIALTPGMNLIGRDPAVTVWIDDTSVSRQHARIQVAGSGALLEDLGSKNGTRHNGKRVAGPQSLADGDRIEVGSATLVLRASGHAVSTQSATSTRSRKNGRR